MVEAVGGHDYVEAVLVGPAGGVTVVGDAAPLAEQIPGGAGRPGQPGPVRGRGGRRVGGRLRPSGAGGQPGQGGGGHRHRPGAGALAAGGGPAGSGPWAWGWLLAAVLAVWLSRFLGRRLEGLSSGLAPAGRRRPERPGARWRARTRSPRWRWPSTRWPGTSRRRGGGSASFLVSVGHDLRTPLTTIAGYAEALHEGKVDQEDLARVGGGHAPRDRAAQPPARGPDDAVPPGGRRVHPAAGGGRT